MNFARSTTSADGDGNGEGDGTGDGYGTHPPTRAHPANHPTTHPLTLPGNIWGPSTARVRYHAWPFRLLEHRKESGGAQAIVDEFLASRPCCLYEGFSTPLLAKLRQADDPIGRAYGS